MGRVIETACRVSASVLGGPGVSEGVTGATVAFFGPLQTYMWLTLAIMWSTVALASEMPGPRVAGRTFRDEGAGQNEPLGLFR